jgi:RecB family endonuclease NucS
LDLIAEAEGESVIIELKHGRCGVDEVKQLERYLRLQEKNGGAVRESWWVPR